MGKGSKGAKTLNKWHLASIYAQVGRCKLLRAPGTQAVTYLALHLIRCLHN